MEFIGTYPYNIIYRVKVQSINTHFNRCLKYNTYLENIQVFKTWNTYEQKQNCFYFCCLAYVCFFL